MGKMIMVWKTNAFGSFRVTIEKVSVNGMASLVKFTRDEKYRPAEAGTDGTMWVTSSTIHKPIVREDAAQSVAKRTAETRKGKMPTKARKAGNGIDNYDGVTLTPVRKGKATPQFTSF